MEKVLPIIGEYIAQPIFWEYILFTPILILFEKRRKEIKGRTLYVSNSILLWGTIPTLLISINTILLGPKKISLLIRLTFLLPTLIRLFIMVGFFYKPFVRYRIKRTIIFWFFNTSFIFLGMFVYYFDVTTSRNLPVSVLDYLKNFILSSIFNIKYIVMYIILFTLYYSYSKGQDIPYSNDKMADHLVE